MKIKVLVLIVLFPFLIISCENNEPKNVGKYKSNVNPHPKYFFKMSGRFSGVNVNELSLRMKMIYYAANKKCNININNIEGVSVKKTVDVVSLIELNEKGYFKKTVPIDKYESSYCDWNVGSFSYSVKNKVTKKLAKGYRHKYRAFF